MAIEGVMTTGFKELQRAVEQFHDAEVAALKEVAHQTALREQVAARALLRSQQKTEAHALADAIEVVADVPHSRYLVISQPPPEAPANLPIWNEHGTVFMSARPYMRPANDQEQERYRQEMEAASVKTAEQIFKD